MFVVHTQKMLVYSLPTFNYKTLVNSHLSACSLQKVQISAYTCIYSLGLRLVHFKSHVYKFHPDNKNLVTSTQLKNCMPTLYIYMALLHKPFMRSILFQRVLF